MNFLYSSEIKESNIGFSQINVTLYLDMLFKIYLGGTIVGAITKFVFDLSATKSSPVIVEECDIVLAI